MLRCALRARAERWSALAPLRRALSGQPDAAAAGVELGPFAGGDGLRASVRGVVEVHVVSALHDETRVAVRVVGGGGVAAARHGEVLAKMRWSAARVGSGVVLSNALPAAGLGAGARVVVEAVVPQRSSLSLVALESSVVIRGTLEGNAHVEAGGITASKLRGERVELVSEGGDIALADKVEAQEIRLIARRGGVRVAKALGRKLEVLCRGSGFSLTAGFVNEASVAVEGGSLDVGGFHGTLSVQQAEHNEEEVGKRAPAPGTPAAAALAAAGTPASPHRVSLRGINGQLHGEFESARAVTVQVDSFFAGSSSFIACRGPLHLQLPHDQTVRVRATLRDDADPTTWPPQARVEERRELREDELREPGRRERVDEQPAWQPYPPSASASATLTTALLVGKAREPNRASHRTSGKISAHESAKREHLWGAAEVRAARDEAGQPRDAEAELAIEAHSLRIEVLGWIDRIKSRWLSDTPGAHKPR
jgi:hypothetical protein